MRRHPRQGDSLAVAAACSPQLAGCRSAAGRKSV